MRLRFRNWTENLHLDWCISRQRYFGVPFPVWYPVRGGRHARLRRADRGRRGVAAGRPDDRRAAGLHGGAARPAGRLHRARPTSSTPGSPVLADARRSRPAGRSTPERHGRLFPMDIRPQSHEIIRTWAFYTIAKACCTRDDPLEARGDLRLDPRPGPQEDVEEQGQRGDARCTCSTSTAPTGCATGRCARAPRHRHRLRREGVEGRPAAGDQALQRRQVRARRRQVPRGRSRTRSTWASSSGCARRSRGSPPPSTTSTTPRRSTSSSASSGAASPTPTSSW